jgi:POT family proton-dependent oligopeptide transporter
LLCGLLAQVYGWHYGFGIAAIFMLLGLATYLYGYRYLPARVERRKFEGTRLTAAERRIVYALIAVMIITIFQSTSYYQIFNVNPIWIQEHVALDLGGDLLVQGEELGEEVFFGAEGAGIQSLITAGKTKS